MDKFKGYYFKCTSENHTIAFIPAIHGKSASIQIITDKASYSTKLKHIAFGKEVPQVRTDMGVFSDSGIKLNINTEQLKAFGVLKFEKFTPLKNDIMGPFKLLSPIMQCRHRVISMHHSVNGKVYINGDIFVFINGNGYIEGDEGSSFPKSYLWAQCFWRGGSFMLSAADVPIFGTSINGVIGAFSVHGRELRIGTYLGAKPKKVTDSGAIIQQRDYTLTVKKISDNGKKLYAPRNGNMSRIIKESAQCRLYVKLEKKNKALTKFISPYGSFERSCNL